LGCKCHGSPLQRLCFHWNHPSCRLTQLQNRKPRNIHHALHSGWRICN
jgi:hypothetical protein